MRLTLDRRSKPAVLPEDGPHSTDGGSGSVRAQLINGLSKGRDIWARRLRESKY